jgi:hypothetical protein
MNYLIIKVLLESNQPSYCDIILSKEDTLEQLHDVILKTYHFSGEQMSSFYETNEDWAIIEEIPLIAIDPNYKGKLMKDIKCSELIQKTGDQLMYIYDYLNEWRFFIECMEKTDEKPNKKTPITLKQFGEIPKETDHELSNADAEKILMNAILGDEFDEDENEDIFGSDGFESLDDYEEYL